MEPGLAKSNFARKLILVVFSSLMLATLMFSGPLAMISPRVQNSPATGGPSSWNTNVNCVPTVVTIEQILGNQTNLLGGASENGSVYNPGITSPLGPDNAKSWLTPSLTTPAGWTSPGPSCTISNAQGQVSAFVQINGVQRDYRSDQDRNTAFRRINGGTTYQTGPQSDTTFNIFTPGFGNCASTNTTDCMHALHVAIDRDWKAAGYCGPNTACDNNTLVGETAAYKSLIDVQGFVFWNPSDLNDPGHNFSGWELHSLTAWRISNVSSDYTLSATPNPLPVFPGRSASTKVSVNTFNLFSGNVSFTTIVSTGFNSSGPVPSVTMSPPSVTILSGGSGSSTLTVSTAQSNVGNYTVTVSGSNGTLSRAVSVTVYVVDFSITANPASLSVPIGSSAQSIIMVGSINGFAGNVSLATQVSPSSLTAGVSPSEPTASLGASAVSLAPRTLASVIITVSASILTLPGSYVVTVTANSGGLTHVTAITVTVTVAGLV